MTALELSVLDALQGVRCGFLDTFFSTITHLGDAGIFWILLTLALLCTKKYRRAGVAMACALVLDLIFCNLLLKLLVGRLRPFAVNTAVALLVPPPLDASFPSGHTASSFAAAAALWAAGYHRMGAAALVLACAIAFSRLYLYVHWPSDVLAGAILGAVLGWSGAALVKAASKRRSGEEQP